MHKLSFSQKKRIQKLGKLAKRIVHLHPLAKVQQKGGAVAQSVEQRTENPCVGGSIPSITTKKQTAMKINRKDLAWYMKNIRRRNEGKELTDEELVDQLANWMETNPGCVDMDGVSHPGRFSYSTVGYGIFSLLGEKYRMGRVEIFDSEDDTGYAVSEGSYCMPHVAAHQFEDFIESLETDLPINIEIGSHKWCEFECAKSLGFENAEEMRDPEKIKAFQRKKNDAYAQEQGY